MLVVLVELLKVPHFTIKSVLVWMISYIVTLVCLPDKILNAQLNLHFR